MNIKCCKDCEFRYPACHDKCEIYRAEKQKMEAGKKAKQEQVFVDSAIIQAKARIKAKIERGHRR